MHLPQRLQLKPSRWYFLFLASGHVLAGVAVCLLPLAFGLKGAALLVLALSFLRVWHMASRNLPALLLRADGNLEVLRVGCEPLAAKATADTLVWPWLVVLHLRADERIRPLVLFPDGLAMPDGHRQLRLWLRWGAAP